MPVAPGSEKSEFSSPRQTRRPEWLLRVTWIVILCALVGVAVGYGTYAFVGLFTGPDLTEKITLQAEETPGVKVTSRKLESCASTIEKRLADLGIESYKVTTEGEDTIVVALPGGTDIESTTEVLVQPGYLEFYPVADLGQRYGTAEEALEAAGVTSDDELPLGTSLIFWPAEEWRSDTDEYYLVTAVPALTGELLMEAAYDDETSDGSYRITMEFDEEGAALFADVTRELAEIGAVTAVAQQLAIVLDGTVYSAPTVEEEISGGSAEVTGEFTLQQATELVAVLRTSALPLELVAVD